MLCRQNGRGVTGLSAAFIQRVTLPITGFGFLGSGALIIERALFRVPGVTYAYVSAETEMAYVQYDPERCSLATLRDMITRARFDVDASPGR